MPVLRKLTAEEVQQLIAKPTGERSAVQAMYDELIADLNPGDYATVSLDDSENKQTTRNRLKGAAERRNLSIKFLRTRDQTVTFNLEVPEDADVSRIFGPVAEEIAA